ncbi:hypothetical protein [Pyxidicoccus fallax]|uniref:hypothetical protein n=1 Tax=Pyxidicoccus fallax TaxID=394095 RepID=UPI0020A64F4C|nr:hypothetical protein [Pyxidicoccus fallax]
MPARLQQRSQPPHARGPLAPAISTTRGLWRAASGTRAAAGPPVSTASRSRSSGSRGGARRQSSRPSDSAASSTSAGVPSSATSITGTPAPAPDLGRSAPRPPTPCSYTWRQCTSTSVGFSRASSGAASSSEWT